MGIKVVGLMHTGVRITPEDGDVEKALSIWQDMLGLKIDSSRPDFPDIPGAWLNFDQNGSGQGEPPQQIHIFGANGASPRARSKREDPTRPHVALAVESLDDAKRDLESRDIDYWIYSGLVGAASEQVFFEDGFGNMIELQEAPA